MSFIDKLDQTLLASDINYGLVLPEDKRQMAKFFDAIKKLLALDASSLFRLANDGGDVQESVVINDLYLDILKEAADNEDYGHMSSAQWSEPDPLELDPIIKDPTMAAKSVFNSNYHKVVEIRVKTPEVSFKGYVIDKLSRPDEEIAKELKEKLKNTASGGSPPFRWFRNVPDALREIDVLERSSAKDPLNKPSLKQPKQPKQQDRVVHPNPTSIEELLPKVVSHFNKGAVQEISNLDRRQLIEVVKAGKEATSAMSVWSIAKTLFLGYLSLAALVHGSSGLAALVIGFLAVQGINFLRTKKQSPQTKQPPLRIRQKPSTLRNLYK
jgi:hypothetical protein